MAFKHNISTFWSRVGALILDCLILGIVGYGLGMAAEDFLVSLGVQGLLLGFAIAFLYFAVSNSELTNGQTIGKRILKIKAVDGSGHPLSMQKSVLRALIMLIPYFLLGYPIPGFESLSAPNLFKAAILGSALLSIIVLYIANTSSRQSLHDLLLGTYVVQTQENEEISEAPKSGRTGVYVSLGLTAIALAVNTNFMLDDKSILNEYSDLISEVEEIPGVVRVGSNRNTTTFVGGLGAEGTTTESFTLHLHVSELQKQLEPEESEIIKEAARILLEAKPEFEKLNVISITVSRGYDIGIASRNYTLGFTKQPEEWLEMINSQTPMEGSR